MDFLCREPGVAYAGGFTSRLRLARREPDTSPAYGGTSGSAGSMTYPGAGLANSTGRLGSSFAVGTAANNWSTERERQLPAVSAGCGNFPTLNQNTAGTASNVTGTVAVANGGLESLRFPFQRELPLQQRRGIRAKAIAAPDLPPR